MIGRGLFFLANFDQILSLLLQVLGVRALLPRVAAPALHGRLPLLRIQTPLCNWLKQVFALRKF